MYVFIKDHYQIRKKNVITKTGRIIVSGFDNSSTQSIWINAGVINEFISGDASKLAFD